MKMIQLKENPFDSNSSQKDASGVETTATTSPLPCQKIPSAEALRQEQPLRKSVLATTPSKGPPVA